MAKVIRAEHQGMLDMPRILVVDANKTYINSVAMACGGKEPLVLNGCEIVPLRHKEPQWEEKGRDAVEILNPKIQTMDIEQIVTYATNPENRIDGILINYQHGDDRHGWLLPRLVGSRLPVAVHTLGNILKDGVGNEVVRFSGAIGMFDKSEFASVDPKQSGLMALKDEIERNRTQLLMN